MKKNLFFAALAAVALTAGFTSCDKNDDDASVYEETYNVRFENSNYESAECVMIQEAFRNGLNMTDTLDNSIVVRGKSKADCDSTFKHMIGKVNDQLYTKTWDETTLVLGFRKRGDERLFMLHYEPVTNDYWLYNEEKILHFTQTFEYSQWDEIKDFICFLGPVSGTVGNRVYEMIKDGMYKRGTFGTINANYGANAHTNLFYAQIRYDQKDILTDAIAVENSEGDVPDKVTLNGHTYTRPDDAKSLNSGYKGDAQAPQVYIYTTTEDIDGTAICFKSLHQFYSVKYVLPYYQGTFWFFKTSVYADNKKGDYVFLTGMDEQGYNDCKAKIEEQDLNFHLLQRYNYNKTTQQLELVGPCCLNEGIGGCNIHLCWGTKKMR